MYRASGCSTEETEVTSKPLYMLQMHLSGTANHNEAALTGLPAALQCTLQDKEEGEGEAMHGDHAVGRSC